ncbi:PR domain zinc finger protein 8 [Brienomyrus brachyistius]|uniref:PR domain zinc finger protein 8 n=1 Tax=Brienomyrus brachyistius TaxID=42636 RepID=UPI0020B32BE8|nr:PR domain zinc finger protein 8 [Brienomyrus brachyistius]
MELSFHPCVFWDNDSKFQQHHLADVLTSVHVTRDLPLGAAFGPFVLQNTFYDTIAFIALKSCDKRSGSHVFRVDTETMNNSPLALSWLRFVQAACNKDEQNMEAYLKNGQLYFRSLRSIRRNEELLVWYGDELSHLLGFTDLKTTNPNNGFKCINCSQTFKNEYPYLAHCRFLCAQMKNEFPHQKTLEVKQQLQHRVTDFHNIARDLERKKSSTNEDTTNVVQLRKRKYEESESSRAKKSVLLEKNNNSNASNITNLTTDISAVPEFAVSLMKLSADRCPFKKDLAGYKHSAFTEVKRVKEKIKNEKATDTVNDMAHNRSGQSRVGIDSSLQSSGSAFSFVLPKGIREEQKSAFCKPDKRAVNESAAHPSHTLSGSSARPEDVSETITSKTVLGYSSLMGTALLNGELAGAQSVSSSHFACTPEAWPRAAGVHLQTASLTLLPPTLTSFGVSVQNWCAKCNLSFRMTSDLVFHMRSHHKKDFAPESQMRRREEKLSCPICHEYFRERHHLSRHMTSHS